MEIEPKACGKPVSLENFMRHVVCHHNCCGGAWRARITVAAPRRRWLETSESSISYHCRGAPSEKQQSAIINVVKPSPEKRGEYVEANEINGGSR